MPQIPPCLGFDKVDLIDFENRNSTPRQKINGIMSVKLKQGVSCKGSSNDMETEREGERSVEKHRGERRKEKEREAERT